MIKPESKNKKSKKSSEKENKNKCSKPNKSKPMSKPLSTNSRKGFQSNRKKLEMKGVG